MYKSLDQAISRFESEDLTSIVVSFPSGSTKVGWQDAGWRGAFLNNNGSNCNTFFPFFIFVSLNIEQLYCGEKIQIHYFS